MWLGLALIAAIVLFVGLMVYLEGKSERTRKAFERTEAYIRSLPEKRWTKK